MTSDTQSNNSAPLAGLRVVEITSIYSGPLAGMLLAELGAEVIKVESQEKPDLIRHQVNGAHGVSPVFFALNRGKKFASINASTPEGRKVLGELVDSADVFIHNLRPTKPAGIGLSYEAVSARNPRLIYGAISGLGTTGPDIGQPVYDYVIQARVGMVDYQRDVTTGQARLISQVLVDKTSAYALVQAVLAALYVRERTGRGQRVDVPMIATGLHFGWPDMMAPRLSYVNPPAGHDKLPSHLFQMPAGALLVVRCSDDIEIACSPALPPWEGFAIALDRPDWIVDERYETSERRGFNLPHLLVEIYEAAATFTGAELLARFQENDVASGPVQLRRDMHKDPQIIALDLVTETETGHIGRVRQPRPMWHFEQSKAITTTSIGRTGEDTEQVLRSLGKSDSEIAALIASGAIATADESPLTG